MGAPPFTAMGAPPFIRRKRSPLEADGWSLAAGGGACHCTASCSVAHPSQPPMRATIIKPTSPGHHAQGLSAGQGSLLIRLGSDYGAGGARRGAGVQATTWRLKISSLRINV